MNKGDIIVYDGAFYRGTILLCPYENTDDHHNVPNIAWKGHHLACPPKFSWATFFWTTENIARCAQCERYMVTPEVDYICSACRLPSDVFHAKLAVHGYLRKIEASAFMP